MKPNQEAGFHGEGAQQRRMDQECFFMAATAAAAALSTNDGGDRDRSDCFIPFSVRQQKHVVVSSHTQS